MWGNVDWLDDGAYERRVLEQACAFAMRECIEGVAIDMFRGVRRIGPARRRKLLQKVQQELARPGVVEHFFPENDDGDSAAAARLIRTAFAGLYSLGADANDEDMKAVKEVLLQDGEGRYVLKPQREGGGYNFYGKQLADKLRSNCTITTDHDDVPTIQLSPALSEFILMERLFPPQQRAILLRNGRVEGSGMTISELGCFGTIVVSGEGDVVHNEYAGFLLRTKFSGVDEGGVASGFATLSSPYLC